MEKAAVMVTRAPQSLGLTTVLGVITTPIEDMSTECANAGVGGSQRKRYSSCRLSRGITMYQSTRVAKQEGQSNRLEHPVLQNHGLQATLRQPHSEARRMPCPFEGQDRYK
jgi:hypothetical protein